jgi:Tol biopolymer transport system component
MLAVAGASKTEARPLMLTVDLATGRETELTTPRWRDVTRILWAPDGKHLIAAARAADEGTSQIWMLDYSDGTVQRLTNDLESYFWLSFSADGRMLVTRQQRILSHLWLFPGGDLKKAKQLTFGGRNTDGYVGLAWTPDGKIVYTSRSGHVTDLHSIDPNSGEQVQLTANAGPDNTWPTVSRDGHYIAFTSHRTGARQIWVMDADGRNQKQLTIGQEPRETAYSAALSPDGSQVYFIRLGAGPSSVWKIPASGGTAVPVSHLTNATAEGFLSSSPDGKWLAFQYVAAQPESRGEQPTLTLGILPSDGNGEPRLFDLPMRRPMVQWSADSSAFDYFSGAFNSSSLLRQPLAGGPPQKLLEFPDRVFNYAWSLDGKDLVVARGQLQGDAVLITNLP